MLGALHLEIPLAFRENVALTSIGTMTTTFAGVSHWAVHELALAHFGTKPMVLRMTLGAFSSVGVATILLTVVVVTLATTVAAHARIFILVKDSAKARALDLLTVLTIETPFASTECAILFIR
jgi:hypothetical protein